MERRKGRRGFKTSRHKWEGAWRISKAAQHGWKGGKGVEDAKPLDIANVYEEQILPHRENRRGNTVKGCTLHRTSRPLKPVLNPG